MISTPAPLELEDIAVAGSVTTPEEALQMSQMRFVLMWEMRLNVVARPPQALPLPIASNPPM